MRYPDMTYDEAVQLIQDTHNYVKSQLYNVLDIIGPVEKIRQLVQIRFISSKFSPVQVRVGIDDRLKLSPDIVSADLTLGFNVPRADEVAYAVEMFDLLMMSKENRIKHAEASLIDGSLFELWMGAYGLFVDEQTVREQWPERDRIAEAYFFVKQNAAHNYLQGPYLPDPGVLGEETYIFESLEGFGDFNY